MTGTITTAGLTLEPLRVEHADELVDVLADPALHEFIGGEPLSLAALRARYEHLVRGSTDPAVTWHNWAIRVHADVVGTAQATVTGNTAEVAWVVATGWQGSGIASAAAGAMVAWLRGQGVERFVAHIHPDHHASAGVARAVGLHPTTEHQRGETRWIN